ncbi:MULTISPECIES: methylmalonyl-CoA mutase family protein [unclassified Anoxybacillus]|uniref:methylmalonyl-CoA mutase family protein n=1 Tax=Anoxybacillaceae TaxID=3120669 RepID=UPI0009BB33BF|nr:MULTISPECIES: methylmalonyl-CoA mutase family protein [unclassified Anoxybacillus]OQM45018.1 methylmalonyl-CoA mutase [Anoxybacillus sp. UARK-01]QHC04687.1 methylmalonyl-CoA mutase [Anoxybacillus sp. PDR2]
MTEISTMKNGLFPIPSYEEWKQEVEKSLKGKPIEKLYSTTYENVRIQPIYTRQDIESLEHLEQLPGFADYVRGTEVNGYLQQPWFISQELSAASAKEWNEMVKHDIARGQTAIHLVLDRLGFLVTTLEDVETMFSGIDLRHYPIRVDAGACSLPFLALFATYLQKQQVPLEALHGEIGMDPLGGLVQKGQLPVLLEDSYDMMADVTKWAMEHMPNIRTVIVHGESYHNGGANAVQELAFAFAAAAEYINECLDRGLEIDDIAQRISFSFAIGSNFFMEIAKLRAARVVWSNIVQAFGGSDDAQKLTVHARTSYFTKTIYDPYVNMLRATSEAFAAVVGGMNSLHVSPFDEAIQPADEFSRRIARNTQLILLEEAHIGRVIDPAGGSYYVETLTAQVARETWKLFQQIEAKGGMTKALEEGFVQSEVNQVAEQRDRHVKTRKEKIVGTNVYANLAEPTPQLHRKHACISVEQSLDKERVDQLKKEFAAKQWVKTALSAVSQRATVQEIEKALESSGLSFCIQPIPQWRLAEPFEQLRKAAEAHLATSGKRPTVRLINLGPIPNHKARADFITGFFEAGGFEVVKNDGYMSVQEAVQEALRLNGSHYIICGTDESYIETVPLIATELKKAQSHIKLYVAGKQNPDREAMFTQAGIDGFIHIGSNCYETLVTVMKEMGVALDE